ncbi:MAG: hypothetical protein ACE14L_11190 [Terriglobales bacterium]
MQCDLCKRDVPEQELLCESCADAIRRLVNIHKRPEQEEKPRAAAARAGG